jgi:hypothetical protein
MAKQKKKPKEPPVRVLRVKKGDSLKTIYAKAHKAFTADDLYRCITPEPGPYISLDEMIAELEALDREDANKRRKKTKHGRSR